MRRVHHWNEAQTRIKLDLSFPEEKMHPLKDTTHFFWEKLAHNFAQTILKSYPATGDTQLLKTFSGTKDAPNSRVLRINCLQRTRKTQNCLQSFIYIFSFLIYTDLRPMVQGLALENGVEPTTKVMQVPIQPNCMPRTCNHKFGLWGPQTTTSGSQVVFVIFVQLLSR